MHYMIDLETMGTAPGSAIVAVGVVAFDAEKIHDTFYETVSLESSVAWGLTVDASTVMWWMQQSDAARAEILEPLSQSLHSTLDTMCKWMRLPTDGISGVWGNGATFDNVLIRVAMEKTGVTPPWKFWQDKCYRTVKGAHPEIDIVKEGTAHKAIDDALSQAKHLMVINKAAGGIYL